jgi:predicted ATPase/class 3 adenylate cyclase
VTTVPDRTDPEPRSRVLTFLFTDIQGSTGLVQELGARYEELLAQHNRLIEDAVTARGGSVFGSEGDAIFAAFEQPSDAVEAALDAQRELAAHAWPDDRAVKVRMGIHTGEATRAGGTYVGLTLHRAARITAAGHGGMILVSSATSELLDGSSVRLVAEGTHRLKDLAEPERLFRVDDPSNPGPFPPLRTLSVRNNLPVQLTTFVGRDELAEVRRVLMGTRLLTLTGPGGTGKTRLALELAGAVIEEFSDGAFFVALDAVTDPPLVMSAIAASVGVEAGTRPPLERVSEWAADRHVLLVLDNFEQVVGAAPDISQLLRAAPDMKVIVTSRIPLHAYGEQEFPVPALGLPSKGATSVDEVARAESARLFVERAMAVDPGFRLTGENAAAISEVVHRLDGLPLAIELAAARVRILPLDALRSRLDQRLTVLVGGPRDRPSRQQTLRGAIDWSYDMLEEPDRRLFARFSVFAGGSDLERAESVCGPAFELGEEVLDGLASLVDKSLLRSQPGTSADPRFAMLATIREYAHERLEASQEDAALHRRHAEAYAELVEGCEPHLTGRDGARWLDRLELDHDNIRACLDWAVAAGETRLAIRIAAGMWRYWQIRGHLLEASERLDRVLAMPGLDELSPDLRSRLESAAGSVAYWRADIPRTHRHYKAALEHARRSGNKPLLAEALYNFAFAWDENGTPESWGASLGAEWATEALAIYEELGDERGKANAHWALGFDTFFNRDWDGAEAHLRAADAGYTTQADDFGSAWAQHFIGLLQVARGNLPEASAAFARALNSFVATRDTSGMVLLLADLALLARREGREERSWRLAGAADALRRATGVNLVQRKIEVIDWDLPARPVDDPEALRAWDAGTVMTVEQAVHYALERESA